MMILKMKNRKINISDMISKISMPLAHVTKTGNISIPKQWRDELGIEPNSDVVIEKVKQKIIIEPLGTKKSLREAFKAIDEEIRRKGIKFTMEEAIKDDLYD